MTLPQFSIRHYVMAVMLSLFIVLVGIIGYLHTQTQDQPNVNYPVITVKTYLPGGNPTIVNDSVTKPMEKQFNTIPGVKTIQSRSIPGQSTIEITFELGKNMDMAYNEVVNRINHVRSQLPYDAKPPLVSQSKSNATGILLLSLHGDRSLVDMDHYAREVVEKQIENIPGVAEVQIEGVSKVAVNINLDLTKLAAYKISPGQVQAAYQQSQISQPGGNIRSGKKKYSLSLDLQAHSVAELENMVVAYRDKAPVLLKQVATITFGLRNKNKAGHFNEQPSVGISVVKRPSANTVAIAKEVLKRVNSEVIPALPSGMHISVVYNEATYVLAVVNQLTQDIWISILCAAIVILLFLRSFRATFIVVCSVPVSLLGAVIVIYAFGYTFNAVTLLGMIVLVGVVVDDSIVVLENIARFISSKKGDRKQIAGEGASQVVFAVFASSITLVCIFFPVIFMGGVIALLFSSFGVVVAGGVLVSLVIALTLTPVLCSRFLKPETTEGGVARLLDRCFEALEWAYKKCVGFALSYRWLVILLVICFAALAVPSAWFVSKGFMPAETDTGYFQVTVQPPQGFSNEYTQERMKDFEALLKKTPGIKHYFSSIGPGKDGKVSVQLNQDAIPGQKEIMDKLRKEAQNIPGAEYFVQNPSNQAVLTYQIRGPSYEKVVELGFQFLNILENYGNQLGQTYIEFSPNQPQFNVILDRVLANSVGITAEDVSKALMVMGEDGVRIGHFHKSLGGERYDVLLKAQPGQFTRPEDAAQVYVGGHSPQVDYQLNPYLVRLDTIATIEKSLAPSTIVRTDLQYSIGYTSMPNISTAKAIQLIQKLAKPILPKGYVLKLSGNAASFGQSEMRVLYTLLFILVLVYMVLASQFNSFIQPLIVMVAQPLAIVGGLLILWLTGESLNVYSVIGMMLLVGLVTKNSILLVDLTNRIRKSEDKSIHEALSEACPIRMRPVVMTSLTIILALLPAAIITGPGASAYRPLAWVIVGGMVISTILTLIVIPSLYSLVENAKLMIHGKRDGAPQ